MQFEFAWINPSLVICRTCGRATTEDFIALTRALVSSPKYVPGMDRVIDLSAIEAGSVTAADIEQMANEIAVYAKAIKTGRLALVVGAGSPLRFGLARMFEAYFGPQVDSPVSVCEALDSALVWLGEDGSSLEPAVSEAGRAA